MRQYFKKVQLLTYKQIIAIKKFGRVQLQYEDFKLIVKYRGVGNVSEHVYNLVKKHHLLENLRINL